jgi:ribonuclease Z
MPEVTIPVVNNLPIKRLQHGNLTVEGYSRAAVQTYWRIPELKVGFDLGAQPWLFMGTPKWFVSHGHMDHIAALPVYIARRRMMKMAPPTIYLPEATVEPVRKILWQFSKMDRGRLPCELVPLAGGEEIELSRELIATVIETSHTVPSLGFVIWDRRKKLKPEYLDLPGEKIRDLRLSGVEITNEIRVPLVAYMGDCRPASLDVEPAVYNAKILIVEVTFVSPKHRKEKIHKFGHIHLDDILERRDRFQNELIVASHFSTRYGLRQIRQLVERAVPDMFGGRLHLWL